MRAGGVWTFMMHRPDGVDRKNKITFLEIVKPGHIGPKHGGDKDYEPVNFQVAIAFAE